MLEKVLEDIVRDLQERGGRDIEQSFIDGSVRYEVKFENYLGFVRFTCILILLRNSWDAL